MEFTIQVEGLVKKYGATTALAGVSFSARPGSVLGLLGPSGAGKTTAIHILATLVRPDAGQATVLGHDVVADAAAVRARIGLAGPPAAVGAAVSGPRHLSLVARLVDLRRRAARRRADELLAAFGLAGALGPRARPDCVARPRRVGLVARPFGQPDVLLLDEPTVGLDARHRGEVREHVRALAEAGVTVLLGTQYREEVEQLADDLVVIDRGRVVATGTPAMLKLQAGGQRLHVRPQRPTDLVATRAVVAEQTGGLAPSMDSSGEIVVRYATADLLHRVRARLEADRLPVAELSLRLPSLDEVFRSLIGHSLHREARAGTKEYAA
jgi:oleandomycin transport system ATP-binding protein